MRREAESEREKRHQESLASQGLLRSQQTEIAHLMQGLAAVCIGEEDALSNACQEAISSGDCCIIPFLTEARVEIEQAFSAMKVASEEQEMACSALKDELRACQSEKATLQQEIEDQTTELNALQQSEANHKEQLRQALETVANLTKEGEALGKAVELVKEEMQHASAKYEERIVALDGQKTALRSKVCKYESACTQYLKNIADLKAGFGDFKLEIQREVEAEHEGLSKQLRSVIEQFERQSQELALKRLASEEEAQKLQEALAETHAKLRDALDAKGSAARKMGGVLDKHVEEARAAKAELKTLTARFHEMKTELEAGAKQRDIELQQIQEEKSQLAADHLKLTKDHEMLSEKYYLLVEEVHKNNASLKAEARVDSKPSDRVHESTSRKQGGEDVQETSDEEDGDVEEETVVKGSSHLEGEPAHAAKRAKRRKGRLRGVSSPGDEDSQSSASIPRKGSAAHSKARRNRAKPKREKVAHRARVLASDGVRGSIDDNFSSQAVDDFVATDPNNGVRHRLGKLPRVSGRSPRTPTMASQFTVSVHTPRSRRALADALTPHLESSSNDEKAHNEKATLQVTGEPTGRPSCSQEETPSKKITRGNEANWSPRHVSKKKKQRSRESPPLAVDEDTQPIRKTKGQRLAAAKMREGVKSPASHAIRRSILPPKPATTSSKLHRQARHVSKGLPSKAFSGSTGKRGSGKRRTTGTGEQWDTLFGFASSSQ